MSAKSSKPAPLGRGLSALFGDTDRSYGSTQKTSTRPKARPVLAASQPAEETSSRKNDILKMPIEKIQPGAYQPRRHFDEEALQDLAASIREKGLIQPIMLRRLPGEEESYEIIAGERRWRACQLAKLHEVPVIIREFTDKEAMEIGLIENVQREDLSPLEEAEGYRRLLDEFHHTQEGLAKIIGKSRPHITNLLRLLTLPDSVKGMVNDGSLTMGHARAIITAEDPESLAKQILKKGLSVRQTEMLAKKVAGGSAQQKKKRERKNVDPNVLALEQSLENILGLRVKLDTDGTAGSLTIYYSDLDQLDDVLHKLKRN